MTWEYYKRILVEYEEKCVIYRSFSQEAAEEFIRLTRRKAD
jgi:hypothetical protein